MLLAVPALRALRAGAGGAPLVLAAQPTIGALLAALGVVDAYASFEGLGLQTLFVDAGRRAHVAAFERASRIVSWFGSRDPVFVRRLAETRPDAVVASAAGDGSRPVWRHLLDSVGAPAGEWCAPIDVPAAVAADGRRALRGAGWDGATPLVVVHPGAGGRAKRWPARGFARVLREALAGRGAAVVITEGPADRDAVLALGAELGQRTCVLSHPSLVELAGALRCAAAFVGNDSGVGHVAAAVGTSAVILFDADKLAWASWSPTALAVVVDRRTAAERDVAAVSAALRERLG